MKFYFCDACGKRITDKALEDGTARNKQLKGIFCEDCALGVNTIEFEPIKLTPSKTPDSVPLRQPTPSGGATAPKATPALGSAPSHAPHKKSLPMSQTAMLCGAAAIIGLGIVVLAVGLNKRGPPPPIAEPKTSTVVQNSLPPARATPPPSQENPESATRAPVNPQPEEPRVTIPIQIDPEAEAVKAFDDVTRFTGLAVDDKPGRAAALEDFIKEHGDTIVAARARHMINDLKKAPEDRVVPPAPSPTVPVSIVEPAVPQTVATIPVSIPPVEPPKDEIAEADKAYATFLNDYVALLRKRDRDTAAASLSKAEKNDALKPHQSDLAQCAKALVWLADIEASLLAGVEKLRDSDDVEIQTKTGQSMHVGKRAAFQFLDRKEGTLNLGSKEIGMAMPMATFNAQTWEKLVKLGLQNDAPGLLRRGCVELLTLAAGDNAGRTTLKSTLAQARSAGAAPEDVDFLLRLIDVSAKGAREMLAEDALARFEKCFEAKNWVEADRLGRQLLGDYADTAAVKSKSNLRDMVVSARAKGSPVREYTLTFQEGQAVYDAGVDQYSGTIDCYLYKDWPDVPFKDYKSHDSTLLMVGTGWINPLIRFSVFQRDGGPLPNEAEIVSATVSLYKSGAYDPMFEARPCLVPWKVGEVSWNSASKGAPWKKPGGDAAEVAAKCKARWDPCWLDFDLTESVRESQKYGKNLGWFFTPDNQSNIIVLASSRNKDLALRPKLTLKVRTTAMK